MKHSAETRQQAMELMKQQGAQKTHEQTGISLMTLYKWRRAAEEQCAAETEVQQAENMTVLEAAKKVLAEQVDLQTRVAELEAQNAKLTALLAETTARANHQTELYQAQLSVLRQALSIQAD